MTAFARQKSNVLVLAAAQAAFGSVSILVMTLSGLVGLTLAADKALATLPIAFSVIGTAAATIPASHLMARIGRRAGFILGAGTGIAGGALSALAIALGDFGLFCLGNLVIGGYQGFAQFYRFAAAEVAGPAFRSRAISYVLAGGVVAAFAGPQVAKLTRDAVPDMPFFGAYVAAAALSLLAGVILMLLRMPQAVEDGGAGEARPLATILCQPLAIAAVTGSAVGYALMILVMSATPLAMVGHHHGVDDAASVIQWHVLGMFAPSFFTGSVIQRLGAPRVMLMGLALLAGHVAIAMQGVAFLHFASALVLLGVGWNFLYVGGTTLLTQTYRPAERAKVQALNDFLILGVVTAASFSSGALLHWFGWRALNLAAIPVIVATAAVIVWLTRPAGR